MELRSSNFNAALEAAKQAYSLIEPELLEQMNQQTLQSLKQNLNFLERLQVLLVAYFNYGMCHLKIAEQTDSLDSLNTGASTFNQAQTISTRYLGPNHFFTQKLVQKEQRVSELLKKRKAIKPLEQQIKALKQTKSIMKQHEEFLLHSAKKRRDAADGPSEPSQRFVEHTSPVSSEPVKHQ